MDNLPAQRPMTVVQLPDGTHAYADPNTLPVAQGGPQVVHIHQAPPDRTVQRIALGSGVGTGAVAAGVYFGPLLVGVLTAIAANLAMLTFMVLIVGWGTITVVRSIGRGEGANKKSRKSR